MIKLQTKVQTAKSFYAFLLLTALILLVSCGTSIGPKPDKPYKPAKVVKTTSAKKAVKSKSTARISKAAKPAKSATAAKPVTIVKAKKHAKPVISAKTKKPVKPIITVKTKKPAKPVITVQTDKPAKPITTAKAVKSVKPVTPVKLVTLAKTKKATPCDMTDPGYGIYHPWTKNLKIGRMLMPKKGALTSDNGFDLIIHFHGGNAIRKSIADTARGAFVVGIDLGAGSGAYERPFRNPKVFRNLLNNIEKEVAKYTKKPKAHIRNLALTGWSAGYGAIRAILRQKAGKQVDAVVLLDGLHSNYDKKSPLKLRASQLSPFVQFAERAAKGQKTMFVSHSSIVPPGYASTTETAHYLTKKLGIKVRSSTAQDSAFLSRYEQAIAGNFIMRGYHGKGKVDHCAQIALITDVAQMLERSWRTPLARGKSYIRPGYSKRLSKAKSTARMDAT